MLLVEYGCDEEFDEVWELVCVVDDFGGYVNVYWVFGLILVVFFVLCVGEFDWVEVVVCEVYVGMYVFGIEGFFLYVDCVLLFVFVCGCVVEVGVFVDVVLVYVCWGGLFGLMELLLCLVVVEVYVVIGCYDVVFVGVVEVMVVLWWR